MTYSPDASRRAIKYLEGLSDRPVAPSPAAVAGLAVLDEALPQKASDPSETLRLLDEVVSPATVASAGPRFFGFVIGGSLPVSLAANWLAGAWDQNSALYRVTPGTARLENIALSWLLEILGLPKGCGGAFVTGATVANFCALAAARHAVLARAGWNVESDGLFGAPPVTVIVGAEVHPSVSKALGMLGLRAQPCRQGTHRLPGEDACREFSGNLGTDDRLPPGGQREHRVV